METVYETETNRIVIEIDYDHDAPYDEGSFPVLWIEYGRAAIQDDRLTSYRVDPLLIDAWEREQRNRLPHGAFERYARIFHGCTAFAYRTDRDGVYVALDPASWREAMGIDDKWTGHPEYSANMFGDFDAYLDGECYMALVQEKCDHGDWHTVDSLGGLYGAEWAREAALEMVPE